MPGTSPTYDTEKATERKKLVLKIQSEIMRSARRFLEQRGFMEVLSPVFEPFTDSGIGDAEFFEIDYYGKRYKLMSALTIHKPLIATQVGDFFSFTPCSRKEPAKAKSDGRHLAQFYQIEVETLGDCEAAMKLLEEIVRFVIEDVKGRCTVGLKTLGRELKVPTLPFKRLTYKEAVQIVQKFGFDLEEGDNLDWEMEKALSHAVGEAGPFFITRFPKSLMKERGILYKEDGAELLDFDLILPDGFGEVSSGSEREFEYEKIVEKLEIMGSVPAYAEYLKLVKQGIKPTSGFGIGLERLTKFICGLEDVAEASPFPKIPGVA